MSLQLNHRHQQIYQALKNTSRHNIPVQPTHTPLLNPCSASKSKNLPPSSISHSQMLHHYQNEIVRNAIDRRRLQFRDFVAEKIRKQQLSKQMEAEHHNLQILGKIDRLKKQRLMLFSERRSDKQNSQGYMTYGKSTDKQQRPVLIEKYANSGKKYSRDHSVQLSREIDIKEAQDKTLFSQLRSKELKKQKEDKNIDIEKEKQKIIKNNKIVEQISHKIQNMQSYLTDKNSKLTGQQREKLQANITNENDQKKENRTQRFRVLTNPMTKHNSQEKNLIKIQSSFNQDRTIDKYSTYLNKGKEETIPNTNYLIDKYDVKVSRQHEYNQKLAEKIRNRWNVESHQRITLGPEEGSISTLAKNNISVFALQSSELMKNRPNSKLEYLENYATLGKSYNQQKRNARNLQEYAIENKIRDELSVRNQMFDQYIERGGIKGLHVHDRLLDSSIFNKNATIDNSDISKEQLSKKLIDDIPTVNANKKKSILKNKIHGANWIETNIQPNASRRELRKNKSKNSARSGRSGRSRSSKSKGRQLDNIHDKRNKRRNSNKIQKNVTVLPKQNRKDQNKEEKHETDCYSDRHNKNIADRNQKRSHRNSNRSQIMSSNKKVYRKQKDKKSFPQYQLSTLSNNNQNKDINAIQKIQKRVRLSMSIFEDSEYRNIIHEKNHLGNTYAVEKSLRQELIEKVCNGAENVKKSKKNRTKSMSRTKNRRSFLW